MNPLFKTAIYVNRASATLKKAIQGKEISDPLIENRPWTRGESLLAEARDSGCDLALIFAQYETLEYWAIAREIVVLEDNAKKVTRYCFSNLNRIPGIRRQRNDLTVISTGSRLPNDFIRSYVLVKTPDFLRRKPDEKQNLDS